MNEWAEIKDNQLKGKKGIETDEKEEGVEVVNVDKCKVSKTTDHTYVYTYRYTLHKVLPPF